MPQRIITLTEIITVITVSFFASTVRYTYRVRKDSGEKGFFIFLSDVHMGMFVGGFAFVLSFFTFNLEFIWCLSISAACSFCAMQVLAHVEAYATVMIDKIMPVDDDNTTENKD